jgi:hypothetical protein
MRHNVDFAHLSAKVIERTYMTKPANLDEAQPFTKGYKLSGLTATR